MQTSSIAAAMALGLAFSAQAFADVETIKKSIAEKIPDAPIRSVTRTSHAGLYEVVINGANVFYTDEKGEIAIFGKMMDLRTRADLTEKRVRDLMTIDFAQLPLEKAIVKTKGNGARKLAIFSDPDCPFCRQLEKELAGIDNVTVYIFLYPLESIHPDAMRKAELIWCSGDRVKAYDELMLEGKEPSGAAGCATPMKDVIGFAAKHWITGTPGMVFANGRLVAGGLPRHQIEALLDAPPAKTAANQ